MAPNTDTNPVHLPHFVIFGLVALALALFLRFRNGAGHALAMFGDYLNIKRFSALFGQRIDCGYQRSKMNRGGSCVSAAELAIEVPKINTYRQGSGAFAFGVFSDVVLGGI